MASLSSRLTAFVIVIALGGCSFASDAIFPSLTSDDMGDTQQPAAQASAPVQQQLSPAAQASAEADSPPALGSTNFEPVEVTPGSPTGTFVGRKVVSLREELRELQGMIRERNQRLQQIRIKSAENSARYYQNVGEINTRLRTGSTPGNPVLTRKWRDANRQLTLVGQDISEMNQLATEVSADAAMAAYLLDSVRAAFNLSGAVEEDHRQLRILEDETNQTVILIERLLSELNRDISRQQQYVAGEERNLNALAIAVKEGQLYGSAADGAGFASLDPGGGLNMSNTGLPSADLAGQRPLVVIRFDRPNVPYEQALYQAIREALDRRPQAAFDVVAVSPAGAASARNTLSQGSARRNAESVLRSLTNMGLPPNRVRLSALSSNTARSDEVHVYVR